MLQLNIVISKQHRQMLVIKCKQEHKIVQVNVSPPQLENAVLFRYSPTPSPYNLPTSSPKVVLEFGERV